MNNRINVLHITQRIDIGGLETLIIELSRKMNKELFNIHILCSDGYDDKYIDSIRNCNISIHNIIKYTKFDLAYFRKVRSYIISKKIHVIHAHSGCFFYSSIFSLLSNARRFIFTAHGMALNNSFQARVEDRIAALFCDNIVAVSDEILATFCYRIPWSRKKISLILNGIDTLKFQPFSNDFDLAAMVQRYQLPKDCFIVGSVGRLEPVKNYPMLLRAFAQIVADHSNVPVHLVLVGDGTARPELVDLARDLGLMDRISFLGMQYRVNEILPLFDAFVLPSLSEGTSISLLEAQACGVPSVVTNVGGNAFVVRHGENGFLCRVNDDATMADALRRLRDEPLLAQRMAITARKRVQEEFSLDSMVRQYEELYLQADLNGNRE